MISIQHADFDVSSEYRWLREQSNSPGAIVTFSGLVREIYQDQDIVALELEHYPGMTEKTLQQIIDTANQRWPIDCVKVIHRVGRIEANEQIVFVGVSSAHRHAAFSACEFIMDFLKNDAPFWKKEITPTQTYWVEKKASDESAAAKWQPAKP
ncbi:molybdopterin synthase catalytic subunit MoaE [Aurantivibrio plasticivorans]